MKINKILSLLVAISLLFSVGITAMAEEAVAKIGDTTYATLRDAVADVKEGETIALITNIVGDGIRIEISKDITLDLGGYTFTDAYIITRADVTIKNGSIKNTNEPYPIKVTGKTLTVEDITLEASKSDRAIWVDGGTLNFKNSSILATKGENNTKSNIYGIWVSEGTTANIYSGSITVDAGPNATAVAICGNYANTVNVYGGKISTSGKNYSYAIWTYGDITVTGGEIVTNEKKYGSSSGITYGYNYAIYTKGNVTISGGTITTNGFRGYLVNAAGTDKKITVSGVEFTNVLTEIDKEKGGHKAPDLIKTETGNVVEISGGQFNGVANIKAEYVVNGATIIVDDKIYTKTENCLTESVAVAKIGETTYATLEEALKELKAGDTLTLLSDVTIDYKWDSRYTGGKITNPVTIDGNGHKITVTNVVNDGYNYYSVFRFEDNATVKNLTIDMTDAISGFGGRFRAISAKDDLTVDKCTFIGNGSANNTRAIVFGEGAGTAISDVEVSVTDSTFTGWRQGVSDNENGQDAKSVVITGNTFTDAGVNVSATDVITFTGNTVNGKYVKIKSYSKSENLVVTATGNTLTANAEGNNINSIDVASKKVTAQKEFFIPATGTNSPAFTKEFDGYVRVWGQSENTNASKSFVLKLYSNDTLMATTNLNNVDNILDGSQGSITWNFYYPESNDEYWTTTWEAGHPNTLNKPTKVELYIDGTLVSTTDAQMNGADGINPVEWEKLGGVMAPKLPEAEVKNLGSITVGNKEGEYQFDGSYYVYDLLGNQSQKLTKSTDPFDMNIAMQFISKDSAEEAAANAYAEYTTDFFIKIEGIKDGSFVGNGCYLAGYYPSFGAWVKIPLDGFTVENGKVYPVISSAGFDFSYVDICTSVENFICGIYLTPEIIAANPDIKVNLTLGLSESLEAAQQAKFETVDDYTYTKKDFEIEEIERLSYLYVLRNTKAIEREGFKDPYYRVRAYAAIDSLNYNEVGFAYRIAGREAFSTSFTTKVYTSRKVTNTTTGKETLLTPDFIAPNFGKYIFAINVWANATTISADTKLEIRPYAKRKDNSIMYLSDWVLIEGLTKN